MVFATSVPSEVVQPDTYHDYAFLCTDRRADQGSLTRTYYPSSLSTKRCPAPVIFIKVTSVRVTLVTCSALDSLLAFVESCVNTIQEVSQHESMPMPTSASRPQGLLSWLRSGMFEGSAASPTTSHVVDQQSCVSALSTVITSPHVSLTSHCFTLSTASRTRPASLYLSFF